MKAFYHNKTILVTGGSQGIGRALIDELISLGAQVATCGRNADQLNLLQSAYSNEQLLCVQADVSQHDQARHFVETSLSHFGKIDALINNAGISMQIGRAHV